MLGGLLWTWAGILVFIGPIQFGQGAGMMNAVPLWYIAAPVGALLLGIGAHWLLRFDRMHRASAELRRDRPAPR
ncbi:MAG: hypothetical protein WA761_00005 [Thermoplasmata archaeon]